MKKFVAILAGAALMAGVASTASAAFVEGNMHLVAFEAAEGKPLDTTGIEAHADLGGSYDISNYDTGITLEMLGANTWSEAYVGILGAVETDSYGDLIAAFTSDTANFNIVSSGYNSFMNGLDNLIPSNSSAQNYAELLSEGPYNTIYQVGGSIGTYAQTLGGNVGASDMGANVNLAALDVAGGFATTTLYSATYDAYFGYEDVAVESEYYLYAKSGSLWVTDDAGDVPAVPVPAAAWLLGSGLLGLISVRRKKRI